MKYSKRIAALLLALTLCCCTACSKTVGSYRVVKTLSTEQFRIGFRDGDQAAVYVNAALKVLAADGTIHSLALKWFGTDNTTFDSDAGALDALGDIPQRTFIMGLNEERFPMSYADGDGYSGGDAVLAAVSRSVHELLPDTAASAGRCSISPSPTATPTWSSRAATSTVPGAAWCSIRPTARTARTRKNRR